MKNVTRPPIVINSHSTYNKETYVCSSGDQTDQPKHAHQQLTDRLMFDAEHAKKSGNE